MRIDGIGYEAFHRPTEVAIDAVQEDGFNGRSFQSPVALSSGFVVSLSGFGIGGLPLLVGAGDLGCVLKLCGSIRNESCRWSLGSDWLLSVEGRKYSREST